MSRAELVSPARRLPDVVLPALVDRSPTPLLPGGRPVGCLLLHDLGCLACGAFLARLGGAAVGLVDHVRAVVSSEASGEAAVGMSVRVVLDRAHAVSRAIAVEPPAWLVADPWGAILVEHHVGDGHAWPDPATIVEWLEWARCRCPECEGEAL